MRKKSLKKKRYIIYMSTLEDVLIKKPGRPVKHKELQEHSEDRNKYFTEYMKLKFFCEYCNKHLTVSTKYKHFKRPCHLARVAKALEAH